MELIDAYPAFVTSRDWEKYLKKINNKSRHVALVIEKYGIGTNLTNDFEYDFESGCLLEDIPKNVLEDLDEKFEKCHEAIAELAEAYARFAKTHCA